LEGYEAVGVGLAADAEEVEHGCAGVDCEGLELGLGGEELSEEAAVAVAQREGATAVGELGEEMGAGALEEGSEAEVFGPAVEVGYAVKVRISHRAKGRRRRGVRRARSAAARRWRDERRWRWALRRMRAAAVRAQAMAGRLIVSMKAWVTEMRIAMDKTLAAIWDR
jgi:hypothetical protein